MLADHLCLFLDLLGGGILVECSIGEEIMGSEELIWEDNVGSIEREGEIDEGKVGSMGLEFKSWFVEEKKTLNICVSKVWIEKIGEKELRFVIKGKIFHERLRSLRQTSFYSQGLKVYNPSGY